MKKNGKQVLFLGGIFIIAFAIWTALIQMVDVQPLGQNATNIGFATFNCWFHRLTNVNMTIYTITDWMGLIPLVVCLIFAGIGLVQLIKRRSLFKVDPDIIILGVYYVIVILAYFIFEIIPINYRPILINGIMEASYPSSTTNVMFYIEKNHNDSSNRFFCIHGYRQIDFRSTLVYGYCGWCIVKCRIIYCL